MNIKQHKVVGTLPSTVEADSIYFVKVGPSVDIYVTNSIGTIVAYPLSSGGGGGSSTTNIDKGYLASASVPVQNVNTNGILNMTSIRADTGWSFASDSYIYTGSPDRVRINVQVHQRDAVLSNVARANPTIVLQKSNNGGAWTDLVSSATGYIRDATGHTESSNSITYVDPTPGTNPQYQVLTRRESSNVGPVNSVLGNFSLEAIEIIQVSAP